MKYLIKFSFPVEPFNTYVREGSIGDKIQLIMSELKPEVLLFGPVDGSRGCYMVVDMKSHSEIPKYAEPMFLVFEADLEVLPMMTPEDLASAKIGEHGKKWE